MIFDTSWTPVIEACSCPVKTNSCNPARNPSSALSKDQKRKIPSALALATGEYVVLLDHEDELTEHALYLVAVELNAHAHAALIYSDEDKITEYGTSLTSSRIGIRIYSCARIW